MSRAAEYLTRPGLVVSSTGFTGRYGAAALTMGGASITESATNINPLMELTPSPIQAASYGMLTVNPITAMGRVWTGFTGKRGPITLRTNNTSWRYTGAWGYKTLLTGMGVDDAATGVMAKMSLGNVMLSATEGVGRLIGGFGGMEGKAWVQAMSNARRLGIAGMLNTGAYDPKADVKHKWIYYLAGIDPDKSTWGSISGKDKDAIESRFLRTVKSKGILIDPLEKEASKKAGVMLAGGVAGRAITFLSGVTSLMTIYDITQAAGGFALNQTMEGVGDFTRGVLQYLEEARKPEAGRGRIPRQMMTTGAATERQRALQATYGARINPSSRMYGNEATYQHVR